MILNKYFYKNEEIKFSSKIGIPKVFIPNYIENNELNITTNVINEDCDILDKNYIPNTLHNSTNEKREFVFSIDTRFIMKITSIKHISDCKFCFSYDNINWSEELDKENINPNAFIGYDTIFIKLVLYKDNYFESMKILYRCITEYILLTSLDDYMDIILLDSDYYKIRFKKDGEYKIII